MKKIFKTEEEMKAERKLRNKQYVERQRQLRMAKLEEVNARNPAGKKMTPAERARAVYEGKLDNSMVKAFLTRKAVR